jgi:hypothetical protein
MKKYNKYYSVTEDGNIFSHLTNKFITPHQRKNKYGNPNYVVCQLKEEDGLFKRNYFHRVVAKTYIPNPNNLPEINHIDGDKSNNKVSNLEWVSHKENCSKEKRPNNLGALSFKYYPRNSKGHIIKSNKSFTDLVPEHELL